MSATHANVTAASAAPLEDESVLPGRLEPVRRMSLLVGAAGLGVWVLGALIFPKVFFPAYLPAFLFFVGIGVGSLGLIMMHHLAGGEWGFIIRRPLEAATMTLPVLAALFLPLLIGALMKVETLYPWTVPSEVEASEVLKLKSGYLNVGFWFLRAVVYFGLWNGLAFLIRRNSVAQDATTDPSPTWRNQTLSAPGLVFSFVSVTFAAVDWSMSIEPEWYSTIYGVLMMVGWLLSALSAAVIVSSFWSRVRPLDEVIRPTGFNDLGNLMLAFTMLWAYMSFSQYLIIWSGNLAEEVPWYLRRSVGGWRFVCLALMLFHFFVPFFCLLIREVKRTPERLWRVAVAVLVMHFVNDTWLVLPAHPDYQWAKLLALVAAGAGVGGIWLWAYTSRLTERTLVPRNDPLLHEAMHYAGHGGGH